MARREFVQLARHLDLGKHKVASGYWSPKLDGMRALWLPIGIGLPVADLPWANTLRDNKVKYCTGLWSRLGKPIPAPRSWTEKLPPVPLDGELYLGKGSLEATMAVKCEDPDPALWADVRFMVFDTPSRSFFGDGEVVYDAKTRKRVDFGDFASKMPVMCPGMFTFEKRREWLLNAIDPTKTICVSETPVILVPQTRLDAGEYVARRQLREAFESYTTVGGEGLMVRLAGMDYWEPQRVGSLLKYKPEMEGEGTVVGYMTGTGKLAGMLGSVCVSCTPPGGVCKTEFTLSGFTDRERGLSGYVLGLKAADWAYQNQSKRMPAGYSMVSFPLGSVIEFKYTSLTAAGVPREARYARASN